MIFWVRTYVVLQIFFFSIRLEARCISQNQGEALIKVNRCLRVTPQHLSQNLQALPLWVQEMIPTDRARLLQQYDGYLLKGEVVSSKVKKFGVLSAHEALKGQPLTSFIPLGKGSCVGTSSQHIKGILTQQCCQNSADAPCLLGLEYSLVGTSVVKQVSLSGVMNNTQSENIKQGIREFHEGRFKKAAAHLELARSKNQLNSVSEKLILGLAYKNAQNCSRAIKVLEEINTLTQNNKIATKDTLAARKGLFALAGCYAQRRSVDKSMAILNGFLFQPQIYKKELRSSLRHPDFRYISHDSSYKTFQKKARRALVQNNSLQM